MGVRTGMIVGLAFCVAIALCGSRITKVHRMDNPARYIAFSEPLSEAARYRHALERLTFGPRPGDLKAIEKIGLKKWVNLQLHPEKVAENPMLAQRLAPLQSLPLSVRDTYLRYPSPQAIRAAARGGNLPDDPELREVVLHLAARYQARQDKKNNANTKAAGAPDPNDDADLEARVKLGDLLNEQQIATLKSGTPDAKRTVLESIPIEKRLDFVYALHQPQRQALMALAPVSLRRELMLSVNPQNLVMSDLTEGKLLRAIYSNRQLEELLVDFWYNHFNVFIGKGADHYSVPTYEREAIRPFVFGKFYDLLLATAKSPAMLFYLDNWQSVGADAEANRNARKNKRGLNENYGRELMELQTLGVDGGYTQEDVINVARCLTGWTIAAPKKGGAFEYNDKMHDKGEKVVLGQHIAAGGGMNDGLEVLQILAHQPATAHFISLQLAQRFVADDPPPSLVNRMALTFLKTDGDLRRVMQTMLESGEFWSRAAYEAKVKSPFEMVVSAVRATGADVTSTLPLSNTIRQLGEPLYGKAEPTGYSSSNAEWVSSASLLTRMNFALALASNHLPGVKVDQSAWDRLAQNDPLMLSKFLLDQDPAEATRAAIQKALADPNQKRNTTDLVAGLTLGSPDFQKR